MTSRRETHRKTKQPIAAPRRALPASRPDRRPSIFDIDLGEAAPKVAARIDRWGPALTTIVLVAYAAALAGYLLLPALSTLTDASVITWTGEGP